MFVAGRSPKPRRKEPPPVGAALPNLGAELDARRIQRVETVAQFRRGRTPLEVIEVARNAVAVNDATLEEARKRESPRAPEVCREGCAWCCHKVVGTAAPEVLRIVAHARAHLSPEEWEEMRERVCAGDEQRRALGPARRHGRLALSAAGR
jgi:hypothetical protein